MGFKALLYAYIIGGVTFIPLVIAALVAYTIYTSVSVKQVEQESKSSRAVGPEDAHKALTAETQPAPVVSELNDNPKPRKAWLKVRRTFAESQFDGGYVTLVKSFLDARSKDPKRSRPKDTWYVVLKGKILYLYEDETMSECEAAIELGGHDVVIFPEGLMDGELFTKRNAICLKPKLPTEVPLPSLTQSMKLDERDMDIVVGESDGSARREAERNVLLEEEKQRKAARDQAFEPSMPWFIFVRSTVEMEDWYHALIHASDHPAQTSTLEPLQNVFLPSDINHLVSVLDEQPDVIPMRWFNALLGRLFYSFHRTENLEAFLIGRLMKKLSKIKKPTFLQDIVVTEVSVGNKTPLFSKPMLKELTKEGDASMEVHLSYKGEFRITIEATALINLGTFKSYTVKLTLAAVLKEIEGNLLVRVKRPPSNRLWYAFTQTPRMVLTVEPIVSDRQITWSMILSTIEARLKEVIQESVVMPNMDDIAFFESSSYAHRGGIWADAARKTKVPLTESVPTSSEIPTVEINTVETREGSDLLESEEPLQIQKSMSAQELATPPKSESASLPEPSLLASATSLPLPADDTKANRRRTWFSSVRNGDFDALLAPQEGDEPERGRSTDVIDKAPSRSQSTSAKSDSSSRSKLPIVTPENHTPARSSSQHSLIHDSMSETSLEDQDSHPRPSTPPKVSDGGPRSPSSAATFLSTLKSRASDKQALTNTAKEAMRKWGVNWGSLRKDSGDDLPDHGPAGSRLRTESVPHSSRASYAEVRAAVTERRNKDTGAESSKASSIAISSSSRRSLSVSGISPSQSVSPPPFETASAVPEDNFSPIHVQPQPKTMSIPGIHASHRGEVQSIGYIAPRQPSPPPAPLKSTVYRLWKNQQQQKSSEESDTNGASEERLATLASSPSIPSKVKPTPPPLPPRRTSVTVSRPSVEPPQLSAGTDSSSQQKLQVIATKDEKTRRSVDSVKHLGTEPPLKDSENETTSISESDFDRKAESLHSKMSSNDDSASPINPSVAETTAFV